MAVLNKERTTQTTTTLLKQSKTCNINLSGTNTAISNRDTTLPLIKYSFQKGITKRLRIIFFWYRNVNLSSKTTFSAIPETFPNAQPKPPSQERTRCCGHFALSEVAQPTSPNTAKSPMSVRNKRQSLLVGQCQNSVWSTEGWAIR